MLGRGRADRWAGIVSSLRRGCHACGVGVGGWIADRTSRARAGCCRPYDRDR
jgi:hypothetical protein